MPISDFQSLMRRQRSRLAKSVMIWLLRKNEVERVENIGISDLRNSDDEHFRETILSALRLLQQVDPRRYRRAQACLDWIAFVTLSEPGAEYHHSYRACFMQFDPAIATLDKDFLTARYACTIVHEATHGAIYNRGIPYSTELRERIERLCVHEENRFLRRLSETFPDIARELHWDFDPQNWESFWRQTPVESCFRQLIRGLKQ